MRKIKKVHIALYIFLFVSIIAKSNNTPNYFDLTFNDENCDCISCIKRYMRFHYENNVFTVTSSNGKDQLKIEHFKQEKFKSFYTKLQSFKIAEYPSEYSSITKSNYPPQSSYPLHGTFNLNIDNIKTSCFYMVHPNDSSTFIQMHKWLGDYSSAISSKLTFKDLINSKVYNIKYFDQDAFLDAVKANANTLDINNFISTIDTTKNEELKQYMIQSLEYFQNEKVLDYLGPKILKNLEYTDTKSNILKTENTNIFRAIAVQNKCEKKTEYLKKIIQSKNTHLKHSSALQLTTDGDTTAVAILFESINRCINSNQMCSSLNEFNALSNLDKSFILPILISNYEILFKKYDYKKLHANNSLINNPDNFWNSFTALRDYMFLINNFLNGTSFNIIEPRGPIDEIEIDILNEKLKNPQAYNINLNKEAKSSQSDTFSNASKLGAQMTDTIICPECVKERITKGPWDWSYSLQQRTSNQEDNFVVYSDSSYSIILHETKYIQYKKYSCSYYLNGQIAELNRIEDGFPMYYDNNGERIHISDMYNYKGVRIEGYWVGQLYLARHFFQDSIDFKYEQQREDGDKKYPDEYLIINLDNEMESYPHHTGYWTRKHIIEAPIDASNKLDSLAYYKNIKTILIDISDFNQDKLLKSKLKALKSMPNLRQISLKGSGFKKIPDEIYLCKNLEVLEMIDTKIKTISPDIINLKKLRSFVLMNTKDFDYENAINYLSQLPNLNSILLQYNLNTPLPRALANCKKLRVLDLGSEIFQVKGPEYKGFTQTQQENLDFLGSLTQVKCLAAPYTSDKQVDYLIKLILDKKLNYIRLYDTIYESDGLGAFRER